MLIALIGVLIVFSVLAFAIKIVIWFSKPILYTALAVVGIVLAVNLFPFFGALLLLPVVTVLVASCIIVAAIL